MPITAIRFGSSSRSPQAWDIHLLRGQSTLALRDRLQVRDAEDDEWKSFEVYRAQHAAVVRIEFRPVFQANDYPTEFRGFGITIAKETGEIQTVAGAIANQPHNFIVEAVVVRNHGGDDVDSAVIRVHLHDAVEKIWLTPRTLTIRRPSDPAPGGTPYNPNTQYAFTVRARFDDATVGDVTFALELGIWGPDENFFWLDAESGIQRIAIPQGSPIGVPIEVKISTTAAWGNHEASGHIVVLRPWEVETNLPSIEWINGPHGTLDGTLKPEQVPNILLLACGFPDSTHAFFQQHTNLIVRRLQREPLLQPYGYLAGSMNFWRLHIPGQNAGVSVRCEVFWWSDDNGQLVAEPVPSPAAPPPDDDEWELEQLIYGAGLPVPADLALAKNMTTQQPVATVEELSSLDLGVLDFSALVGRWHAMLEPPPNVTKEVVRDWLALANRTFIDEVDTFPSIAVGAPPSAKFDDSGELIFHNLRGQILECRRLFRLLRAATQPNQPPITLGPDVVTKDHAPSTAPGNLWAAPLEESARFDNRRFVAPLSNVAFGRDEWTARSGLRLRLYLAGVNLRPRRSTDIEIPGLPVQQDANADGLTLLHPPTLARSLPDNWVTFAHELAHAFGLDDEYVERAEDYPGSESDLSASANLMTIGRIVTVNGRVSSASIKWNWHRIQKASVITRQVEDKLNGTFHVLVAKGDGNRFVVGDGVRLRKREFRRVIRANPRISIVEFVVQSIHPNNLDDQSDDRNMTIVLRNDSIGIDVTPFGEGSLIYMPVRDPTIPLPYPYYGLVSPAADRILGETHGAMTGPNCNLNRQAAHGSREQVPVADDPLGRVPPDDPNRIRLVGIYFGGAGSACGILHPAGQCLMRNSDKAASRFCPVCQYVLIEQIDPRQHGRFDREYAKEYPT